MLVTTNVSSLSAALWNPADVPPREFGGKCVGAFPEYRLIKEPYNERREIDKICGLK